MNAMQPGMMDLGTASQLNKAMDTQVRVTAMQLAVQSGVGVEAGTGVRDVDQVMAAAVRFHTFMSGSGTGLNASSIGTGS